MPFLKIPSAEPLLSDANDWKARVETVKNTFSSRVGQISNAAFDRSVIAYNENSTSEERQKCREEAETLAILTGLEIDSAKTGIKPAKMLKDGIPKIKAATIPDNKLFNFAALELGPLREEKIEIPDSILHKLHEILPENCIEGVETLIKYYIANRQPDTDWVVISHINLDGYLGYGTFTKKLLATIPEDILIRSTNHGVNRYKIMPEFLP